MNWIAEAVKAGEPGQPGEDVELAALRQVLASAERVERLCQESYASLYESDDAILARLGHVWRHVSELAALDPTFQPHVEARDGLKSQLEDLALFLRRYADGIDASPARLQQVEERLALLDRLKTQVRPDARRGGGAARRASKVSWMNYSKATTGWRNSSATTWRPASNISARPAPSERPVGRR